jgi:hypothetical protein
LRSELSAADHILWSVGTDAASEQKGVKTVRHSSVRRLRGVSSKKTNVSNVSVCRKRNGRKVGAVCLLARLVFEELFPLEGSSAFF